jgi:hypothetical protein
MVRTCWAFPPPWRDGGARQHPAHPPNWSAPDLVALARKSLEKGHYKVATQRCCMLQAGGASIPEDLEYLLTEVLASLPRKERLRIQQTGASWAGMVNTPKAP